jgi:hypothetical protein
MLTLAGTRMTCAEAVKKLLKGKRGWEVRSAGEGAKGERWYAWAWLGTASPRHSLLVRSPPEDRRAGLSLLLRP